MTRIGYYPFPDCELPKRQLFLVAWSPCSRATRGPVMQGFKLKVLVADDSALMHSLFADFAVDSAIPFELIRANNGRQCAELFGVGGFNLAFIG
jgi:hypothetical protein